MTLDIANTLPIDWTKATLVGRAWVPSADGPSVIKVTPDGVFDITKAGPTMADLCNADDPTAKAKAATGPRLGSIEELLANSEAGSIDPKKPYLLAPVDLQAVRLLRIDRAGR